MLRHSINISPLRFCCLLITKVLILFLVKCYLEIQWKVFFCNAKSRRVREKLCFYSINLFQENHYLQDKERIKSCAKSLAKLLQYHWQSYSNFLKNTVWIIALTTFLETKPSSLKSSLNKEVSDLKCHSKRYEESKGTVFSQLSTKLDGLKPN